MTTVYLRLLRWVRLRVGEVEPWWAKFLGPENSPSPRLSSVAKSLCLVTRNRDKANGVENKSRICQIPGTRCLTSLSARHLNPGISQLYTHVQQTARRLGEIAFSCTAALGHERVLALGNNIFRLQAAGVVLKFQSERHLQRTFWTRNLARLAESVR